jgi:hypothetical protein
MFRKLLLPAAGLLAASLLVRTAVGRPDDFGVLRGGPTAAGPSGLPAGVVPTPSTPERPADRPSPARPRTYPTYNNPYPLTADAGAWLICAAHYSGPDGFGLAKQVADILRDRHRMPVFILNRGAEERRKQDEEWEALKRQYPGVPLRRRMVEIEDQFAVLVGGYKDFAAATAALPRVRALPMPALKLDGGRSPYERISYTEATPDKKGMVVKTAEINPFSMAMVVRNPLAAAGAHQRWDPFWKTLNADEEYSLLKNPKKYTLIIKQYFGAGEVQSAQSVAPRATKPSGGILGALGFAGSTPQGDALSAGQAQAHELARFLRDPRFGFDSYVLHMRTGSVVTVGGFDGPQDPAVSAALRRLQTLQQSLDANRSRSGSDPIGLLPIPRMTEVPHF